MAHPLPNRRPNLLGANAAGSFPDEAAARLAQVQGTIGGPRPGPVPNLIPPGYRFQGTIGGPRPQGVSAFDPPIPPGERDRLLDFMGGLGRAFSAWGAGLNPYEFKLQEDYRLGQELDRRKAEEDRQREMRERVRQTMRQREADRMIQEQHGWARERHEASMQPAAPELIAVPDPITGVPTLQPKREGLAVGLAPSPPPAERIGGDYYHPDGTLFHIYRHPDGQVETVDIGPTSAAPQAPRQPDPGYTPEGLQQQIALRQASAGTDAPSGPSDYAIERSNRIIASVDELLAKTDNTTTGWASMLSGVPGTAARNYEAELNTLKAAIAFGELTAMREASKTGGALGQVSNIELQLLESALGALDAGQSPEDVRRNLQKIRDSITRWRGAQGLYGAELPSSNEAPESFVLPDGTVVHRQPDGSYR